MSECVVFTESEYQRWKKHGLYMHDNGTLREYATREQVIRRLGKDYANNIDSYIFEESLFADYGWTTWRAFCIGENVSVNEHDVNGLILVIRRKGDDNK